MIAGAVTALLTIKIMGSEMDSGTTVAPLYPPPPIHSYKNKYTVLLNDQWHSLEFIEMKIRPKNCNNI